MTRLEVAKAVKRLPGVSVLVVGDLMLDEYLWGSTERISPEAPVPVVEVTRREMRLGGAGNVISNLVALGCRVDLVSVLGVDADGEQVRRLLADKGLVLSGVLPLENRVTSRKTRVVATGQQMIRVDHENREAVDAAVAEQMLASCQAFLEKGVKAVILSDYGKGTLPEALLRRLIDLAREAGIPVLVDPKGFNFGKYAGASVLSPNRKEAGLASGRDLGSEAELVDVGIEMRKKLGLEALLITRSEQGMSLFLEDEVKHLPAIAREVYDVSGAGDTVIAVLGAAIGAGLDFAGAAELANLAAGVVVGKLGTSTVDCEEILNAAFDESSEIERKILSLDNLDSTLDLLRQRGRKIVFTNGCFDLLHVGHVKYLQAARKLGDVLVLGLNSDDSIRRLKGEGRPLINQLERSHILAALSCVDFVTVFDEDTPITLIDKLRPDVLVKGGDYAPEAVVGKNLVESYGGRIELIQFVDGKSTTAIIEKILSQYGEGQGLE